MWQIWWEDHGILNAEINGYITEVGDTMTDGAAWPRIAALWAPLPAAFVAATAYGAALELYQTTLSARYGTWGDVALNATGAAAALAALTALRRWRGAAARR